MSIWSSVAGVVSIHRDKKTSMGAIVESIFDDYCLNIETKDIGDSWQHTFTINFEEDGQNAFYTAQSFVRTLNQRKANWLELEMNIRWV